MYTNNVGLTANNNNKMKKIASPIEDQTNISTMMETSYLEQYTNGLVNTLTSLRQIQLDDATYAADVLEEVIYQFQDIINTGKLYRDRYNDILFDFIWKRES